MLISLFTITHRPPSPSFPDTNTLLQKSSSTQTSTCHSWITNFPSHVISSSLIPTFQAPSPLYHYSHQVFHPCPSSSHTAQLPTPGSPPKYPSHLTAVPQALLFLFPPQASPVSCIPALTTASFPSPPGWASPRSPGRGTTENRRSWGQACPGGAPGLAPIEDPLHLSEFPGRDVPLQARLQRLQRCRHGGSRARAAPQPLGAPCTLPRAAPSATPRSPHGFWRDAPVRCPQGRRHGRAVPAPRAAGLVGAPQRSTESSGLVRARGGKEPQKSESSQKVTWRENRHVVPDEMYEHRVEREKKGEK